MPPTPSPDAATPFANLGQLFASPWYLRIDDNLRITSYNALAAVKLEIRYRMVDCDGAVQATQEIQTPNTDRTAKSAILVTPEGWLLGGEVFVSGAAPLIGQTFVVVEIVRGLAASALPLEMVGCGYVTAKQPLRFPTVTFQQSLDGGGALRAISGTQPGAGAEVSETVPTGARWELLAFTPTLSTNATVANRRPTLTLDDGANVYAECPSGVDTPAGTSTNYSWFPGAPKDAAAVAGNVMVPLPIGVRLAAGHRIKTLTLLLQGADQWITPRYLVREWIEGA